jgi:hypothetical protein
MRERLAGCRRCGVLLPALLAASVAAGPVPASAGTGGGAPPTMGASAEPVGTRENPAFDAARARFAAALGRDPAEAHASPGDRLLVLDEKLTAVLVERGWQPPGGKAAAGGPGPAERVRVMVDVARALRLPSSTGAMQAAFGTPAENGLDGVQRRLAEARASLAERPNDVDRRESVRRWERLLEEGLAKLPAFRDAGRDWALAELDVNQDGTVDGQDLAAACERQAASGQAAPAVARPVEAVTTSATLIEPAGN